MPKLHMLHSVTDTINTSFILQNGDSTIVIDGGQSVDGAIDKMLDDGNPVNAYQLKVDMENYLKAPKQD